jgi:RNA polymerase sigma-70 factor (ECF subfamily)
MSAHHTDTKNRFLEHLTGTLEAMQAESHDQLSLKQLQEHIDTSIDKLPSKMKAIFVLKRDEQLSHKEIAQRLGIAENTVKKQISNALKILSGTMKGEATTVSFILICHFLK